MDDISEALKTLVNVTTLLAFLLLIVPGTISLRAYDRLRSRRSRKINESFIDIVIASFINDAIWVLVFQPVKADVQRGTIPSPQLALTIVLAFLISPIVLAGIYAFVEDLLSKIGFVSDAEPRPWDKWFKTVKRERRELAIILVMKSDHRAIGGRYVPPGFASSEPAEEAIHIGEVWEMDQEDGSFLRAVDGSLGIFVQMSDVETIEFLEWSAVEKYLGKEKHDGKLLEAAG
jgi:hypothetical protein